MSAVRVCPDRDVECGQFPRAWCDTCPERAALADRQVAAPAEGSRLDPVVEANRALLHQRSQVGIAKYGVTLGEAQLSHRALLQHALEEALDLSNYLQAEIQRTDSATPPLCPECQAREAGAGELPPLPDPLEIDWPDLHPQALGCGVEDRGIHDRYDAAAYGWQDGVDRAIERVPTEIFDADQMHEYARAAIAATQPPLRLALPDHERCRIVIASDEMIDGERFVCVGIERPDQEHAEAARYRWLRDKSEPGICAFYLSVGKAFHGVKFTQTTVDEAIDAARSATADHERAAGKDGA